MRPTLENCQISVNRFTLDLSTDMFWRMLRHLAGNLKKTRKVASGTKIQNRFRSIEAFFNFSESVFAK